MHDWSDEGNNWLVISKRTCNNNQRERKLEKEWVTVKNARVYHDKDSKKLALNDYLKQKETVYGGHTMMHVLIKR